MRIQNTTLADIRLNYRTGQTVVVPSGQYVIRPAGDTDYLDDTAVTLSLFSSGALVLYNDDGSAYSGTPLPSAPSAPPATFPVMVTTSSDGGIGFSVPLGNGSVPVVSSLSGFSPSCIAALTAGATASQSGSIVTITSVGHGIPATQNGRRIYYPGSANIQAGWLSSVTVVDANTLTAIAKSPASVGSESVNSGAAFTGAVTVGASLLTGSAMGKNGRITAMLRLTGDASSNKSMRMMADGSVVTTYTVTSSPNAEARLSARSIDSYYYLYGRANTDYTSTSAYQSPVAVDLTKDINISISASVGAAGGWLVIDAIDMELIAK